MNSDLAPRSPPASALTTGRAGAIVAVALAAIAAALVLSASIGWLAGSIAICGIVGVAIALAGAPTAGALVALLMLGGVAQLAFTEPDWFSLFHLRTQAGTDRALLGILAVEGLVGLASLVPIGARPLLASARRVGLARVLLFLVLTVFGPVMAMRYIWLGDPGAYAVQVIRLGGLALVHTAMIAAIARSPDLIRLRPAGWSASHVAAWLDRHGPVVLAVATALCSALLARFAFHGTAIVEDETAYIFQARTLAAGLLAAPPLPPGTEAAFRYYLLISGPQGWYAPTSPGFAAALVPGVLLGVPWLVNPLLGGLAVLLGHRFTERCSDRPTAHLVAFLMASSPWLIEVSASLMTHALSLTLTLGAWLLLVDCRDRTLAGRRWTATLAAFVAGLLLGWLFMTRALEGVLIGGMSGLWLVAVLRVEGWRPIAAFGAGCIAIGALVFPFNAHFTSNPMLPPLTAYLDALWGPGRNAMGFGPLIGPVTQWNGLDLWPGHSPLEGLVNTLSGLRGLDIEMFGWLPGSLAAIWIWLLWDRRGGFPRIMAGAALIVIAAHFFYWYGDVYYLGPRYWYAAFAPLCIVSAYGLRTLIGAWSVSGAGEEAKPRVFFAVGVLALFATVIVTPWHGAMKFAQRSANSAAIARIASRPDFANAIVFLDRPGFAAAAILNDPLLRPGTPIFVRDLGPEANAKVLAAFPGREAQFLTVRRP